MSIEVMKQALEALECLFGIPEKFTGNGGGDVAVWTLGGSFRSQQAITALRQAIEDLEKQEPKCVAIIEVFGKDWKLEYMSLPVGKHRLYTQQYNYISQTQRQPQHSDFEEYCKTLHPLWNTRISRTEAEGFFHAGWLAAHNIKENT
jgi:hypothetical protein